MGEVRGEVLGAARVEMCAGGKLFGDVETKSLVVQEGAVFEGRSKMGSAGLRAPAPSRDANGTSSTRNEARRRSPAADLERVRHGERVREAASDSYKVDRRPIDFTLWEHLQHARPTTLPT